MYDPETAREIWKMDIEKAERMATENARFGHLRSKEREMLDAALARVYGSLRRAFSSVSGKPAAGLISKRLSY